MDPEQSYDECGCAPSAQERRALWPTLSRRGALGLGAFGLVALGAVATPFVSNAWAVDYPSWDDVQKAKKSESAKAAEVSRIEGLISGLQSEVARTQALAEQAADEFYDAQQAYFDAAQRAETLQEQADEQAQKAVDAANKAGQVASQLYRSGGDDASLELFFAGSAASADDLLARLGTMDKLISRNQSVYAEAVTARDSAQSLSDQAKVARDERDRLQQVAEQKMVASQQAADAAQAALDAQQANLATLEAQLAALKDSTAKTISEYKEGVEARRKAKAEAERKAKEEAERKAREAAEKGGSSGGSSGGKGGSTTSSGWARPSSGWRTSGYGPRTVQCGNSYCSSGFHYGVDLAAGCGAGIYAAHSGTVVYAGYNGGYGNYIKIDHGNGIGTGYGHIRNGGIYVRYGQTVKAGQLIAAEGNTGNSFGCHCHFETYVNGSPVNPITFMAKRGISV
ncbi:peptidoglycan DD-metalloendopeptidase family protein [Microbacterium fluvii]|nr:peptidoglycan DD-metalloendopeptidase family protein [Microbacterium fluvii]MCU4673957.1 peptidoglycan DD-metalloendopeptidase family protein [Microbacterium fluvii]